MINHLLSSVFFVLVFFASSELMAMTQSSNTYYTKNSYYESENILCLPSQTQLQVRNNKLKKIKGFYIKGGTKLNKYSSWGMKKKVLNIKGEEIEFIKVKVPGLKNSNYNEGWIPKKLFQNNLRCSLSVKKIRKLSTTLSTKNNPVKSCCIFPLKNEPRESFKTGTPSFGAYRTSDRRHGACDLYRYKNEQVLSIEDGVIERAFYYYYQGTYAVKVHHKGGFTVVYGELTGQVPSGIRNGSPIKKGQVIGYVGKVNSNCCLPMLHFELYNQHFFGSARGDGIYRRHHSLQNPTSYLDHWLKGIINEKD